MRHSWRLDRQGRLKPLPVEGLPCRDAGNGLGASSYDNMVQLRGDPGS